MSLTQYLPLFANFEQQVGPRNLKRRYHDDVAENCYVVTARHSCEFRDVTNGNVQIRSEIAKQLSRCTVVKLTMAYLTLVAHS